MKQKIKNISVTNIVLALYLFLTPFEDMLNFGFGTVNRYLAILYIVLALMYIYRNNLRIEINNPIIITVFIMLIIQLLSVIWAANKEITLLRNQTYFLLSIMFIISIIRKANINEFKFIKNVISVSGIILAIYMLTINKDLTFSGRAVLTEGSGPNGLAAHLVLCFFINFNNAIESKGIKCIANWIFSGLIFFVVLMTGSRGGLIAYAFSLLLFFMNYIKKIKIIKLIGIGVMICCIAVIVFQLLPPDIITRYFGENAISRDFYAVMSRSIIWRDSIRYLIPQNPLLGYGSGNSAFIMQRVMGYYMGTHNTYLNMIVDYGILLLPLFIYFIFTLFKKIRVIGDKVALMSLTCILIIAFFLDAYAFRSLWNVFIYIGLLVNANKEQENSVPKEKLNELGCIQK